MLLRLEQSDLADDNDKWLAEAFSDGLLTPEQRAAKRAAHQRVNVFNQLYDEGLWGIPQAASRKRKQDEMESELTGKIAFEKVKKGADDLVQVFDKAHALVKAKAMSGASDEVKYARYR